MGLLISLFLILRYLLLQHLVTCLPSSSSSPHQLCPQDQMDALIQFKLMFAVSDMASWRCNYFGTPYPKTQSWNERNPDCCTWDGVWCHGFTGNVIGLDLSCSKLYGSIHQNSSLFRLSHLQQLNLAYNDFTESPILPAFGHFPSLTHLNLSFSNFIGSIPSEISHLSNLVSLDLSSASLRLEPYIFKMMLENLTTLQALVLEGVSISSALPSSLMNLSSLVSLNLHQTELQGNLLSDILYLPKLEELYLSNNFDLTGSFPEKNWSRNSSLKIISLSYTSLSGELDDSIGNLRSLNYLDLSYCKFFGPITALLGNLMQVSQLDLSGNNFTGQIPSTLSKLEHLTKLSLSGNNLEGQIPSAFAKLTRLELLDLSNNRLSGPFPQWTANLTKIINLELSDNLLTGPIPQKINGFQVLQFLSLSNNLLNGTIPPQLFTLPALLIIDLSYNQLTGQFPEFPENSSLQHIALSNNKLHGPIPQSISSLVNLIDLLLSSNNLGGFLDLHMFSNLKQLQDLDLSGNNLSVIPGSNGNTNFPNLYLLGLSSCNLKQFPDVLRNLENLGSLDLSHNNLHGNIPEWFGEIGNSTLQYLILSHNFLTGIGQLPWKCLTILDLSFNKFHGQLPVPPLTTMYFSVSHNELMGEIPSFICGVRQLKFLDLSHNNLSGAIPHCLANFSNGLSVLDLQSNGFQGKIPLTFAKGNMLRSLHLNDNELEGPVPQSLTNCRHLEVLDLGNNKINDTFPYWLGTLPKLQVLILRSNRFHSAIDTSKAKQAFPMLGILDLSYNNFVGPLPGRFFKNFKARACQEARYMGNRYYNDSVQLTIKGDDIHMGRILTILTTIDLSSNKFSGEIASTFQMLSSLIVLNLSHNSLTGHIPASIGDLTILESLDLSSNQLVGEIPKALTRLTFLEVLNLSWNHLVGPIPTGKQFDTFQNDSYAGNMGLCGFPLSNECKDNQAQPQLISQHDNGSNSASGLTLESVVLGYWGGLPLGLLIGLLMFPTGRLKFWFRKVGVKHAKKKGFLKIGYKQSARRNKREYHFSSVKYGV